MAMEIPIATDAKSVAARFILSTTVRTRARSSGKKSFPVADDDSLDEIKKRGLALEWQLYPACIQLFAQNRLQVVTMTHTLDNNQTFQRRVVKILQK
jgi:hypothetical protein